ncbi:MAG TPA: quinone-dependent dihydroorotate dehydrogenase [Ktedonobacteraceae bacterium]|nr:quinone-dependent dihydroorotate dehydrogenase [Ktedonobacteraceae bacterium]
MLFKSIVRPALFSLSASDPEVAHHWVMNWLAFASRHQILLKIIETANGYKARALERTVFGLHFPNPVGLAGGFDKNGLALPALAALGFGFLEAGTVTRCAQAGNERPRIIRLSEEDALINRMGFPNDGVDAIHARLSGRARPAIPVGWSIGKSKITPQEEAIEDYLYSLRKLYDFADFFTVNVSSPNTPGLRKLQDKEPLDQLLQAAVRESEVLARRCGSNAAKPVLVKIAPDLTQGQIDDVIEICLDRHVAGIIATNTTLSREGLREKTTESGGLSGRPIYPRSLSIVQYICRKLDGKIPVVGVGGIFGTEDAKRMFDAGASLIQIYTGFIYEGPALIRRINSALSY